MEFSDSKNMIGDEHDLYDMIKKFIRLRESSQLRGLMRKKYIDCSSGDSSTAQRILKILKSNDTSADASNNRNDDDSNDNSSSADESSDYENGLTRSNATSSDELKWKLLWKKIHDELNDLKGNDIGAYLENYTIILKLHIEQRIQLHSKCFDAL
jgi:hypothetical protein